MVFFRDRQSGNDEQILMGDPVANGGSDEWSVIRLFGYSWYIPYLGSDSELLRVSQPSDWWVPTEFNGFSGHFMEFLEWS